MSASTHTARIYDTDGSVTSQSRLLERLENRVEVTDLRELAPSIRYVPTAQSTAALNTAIESNQPRWLTFTGSGDFHHLTTPILQQLTEPFSLIVFDNHSDWIGSSPCPCGAWLVDALKLSNLKKLVSIGVGKNSIESWRISHGPVSDIISGRVELYPYDWKTSKCLGRRSAQTPCVTFKPRLLHSDVYWNTVEETPWPDLITQIAQNLPTKRVYISIDKDCLAPDYAFSNWDQSRLTLPQLCEALRTLTQSCELIGADITGEYSKIEVSNKIFEASALKIHPKVGKPTEADLRKNEDTNLALVEALGF